MKLLTSVLLVLAATACVKQPVAGVHRATNVFELCSDARFGEMCTPASTMEPSSEHGDRSKPIQVDLNLSSPRHQAAPDAG